MRVFREISDEITGFFVSFLFRKSKSMDLLKSKIEANELYESSLLYHSMIYRAKRRNLSTAIEILCDGANELLDNFNIDDLDFVMDEFTDLYSSSRDETLFIAFSEYFSAFSKSKNFPEKIEKIIEICKKDEDFVKIKELNEFKILNFINFKNYEKIFEISEFFVNFLQNKKINENILFCLILILFFNKKFDSVRNLLLNLEDSVFKDFFKELLQNSDVENHTKKKQILRAKLFVVEFDDEKLKNAALEFLTNEMNKL